MRNQWSFVQESMCNIGLRVDKLQFISQLYVFGENTSNKWVIHVPGIPTLQQFFPLERVRAGGYRRQYHSACEDWVIFVHVHVWAPHIKNDFISYLATVREPSKWNQGVCPSKRENIQQLLRNCHIFYGVNCIYYNICKKWSKIVVR